MDDRARLLVVDLVTPEPGTTDPGYRTAALLDLYMLSLFGGDGGRERSATDFTGLLESAGFRSIETERLRSGMAVIAAALS